MKLCCEILHNAQLDHSLFEFWYPDLGATAICCFFVGCCLVLACDLQRPLLLLLSWASLTMLPYSIHYQVHLSWILQFNMWLHLYERGVCETGCKPAWTSTGQLFLEESCSQLPCGHVWIHSIAAVTSSDTQNATKGLFKNGGFWEAIRNGIRRPWAIVAGFLFDSRPTLLANCRGSSRAPVTIHGIVLGVILLFCIVLYVSCLLAIPVLVPLFVQEMFVQGYTAFYL